MQQDIGERQVTCPEDVVERELQEELPPHEEDYYHVRSHDAYAGCNGHLKAHSDQADSSNTS